MLRPNIAVLFTAEQQVLEEQDPQVLTNTDRFGS